MYLNKAKKIIIKIGSSILVDKKGKLRKKWLNEFSKDILVANGSIKSSHKIDLDILTELASEIKGIITVS